MKKQLKNPFINICGKGRRVKNGFIHQRLRFGDVLKGYIAVTPSIKGPILKVSTLNEGYNIDVNLPIFSAVLSPCCSIGHATISLTPLIEVRKSFFDNPYFAEDLTTYTFAEK